jgi:hypothetical protein
VARPSASDVTDGGGAVRSFLFTRPRQRGTHPSRPNASHARQEGAIRRTARQPAAMVRGHGSRRAAGKRGSLRSQPTDSRYREKHCRPVRRIPRCVRYAVTGMGMDVSAVSEPGPDSAPAPAHITEPGLRHPLAAADDVPAQRLRRGVEGSASGISVCGAGNGRRIAWTAHDRVLVSRSVTNGRAHCRGEESPMSSLEADLITISVRRSRAMSLKPC